MQIYCHLTVKYVFRDKICKIYIAACTGNRNLFQDLKQYPPLLAHAETYLCMYVYDVFGKCLS